MKWRKVIAMLVVAALVGGFIGVPVARATGMDIGTTYYSITGNHVTMGVSSRSGNQSSYSSTATCSVDGIAGTTVMALRSESPTDVMCGLSFYFGGTGDDGFWGDGLYHTITWSGGTTTLWNTVFPGGSVTMKMPHDYCLWTASGAVMLAALSVLITGPAGIDKALGGTWIAAASGGIGPYTYLWDYRSTEAYLNYGVGAFAGSSFHRVLAAGRWFVGVQATDSKGATATSTLAVSSGSMVGAYSLRFTRYGDYGRFVDVTAWDASGEALEITASSGTQAGLPGTDGAFGWVDTANAAAVQDSWAWRYTVSLAVYGVTSPPPEMFWLKGSITIAGGVVLSFQHEFLLITEEYSTIFGADGNPVLPETPPGPASIEPVWLVWLMSKLKETLAVLFVPQMEDINRLLPTSYLVSEWCPIGPNTFANMTSDETFVIPVFGNLRFNLDEVPSGIWTACRVLTQVSISWSLIWVMLAVIG